MIGGPDSTRQKPLDFKPQTMCKWYEPLPLVRIAIDVFISGLFGNFADKREIQSALVDKTPSFNYQDRDDIWLDYVADLGDGFNSTYSIAYLLAQPSLKINGGNTRVELERSSILMMGGDQVYPVASRENYQNRLAGPYQSALPWIEKESAAPHLFAIPGNHDWYDGLTSFTRQFCQQRWIGGWKTLQSTSYYAIQLPHRWWLFALDIQLQADIDKPQLDYFNRIIEQLQPGDSIILATAAPSWVYESFSDPNAQENINFIEKRIEKQGAHIKLNVAGDLHHFAHYKNPSSHRHRITSGGGGAFLHSNELVAILCAGFANLPAEGAGLTVELALVRHQIGRQLADGDAIHHQAEMLGPDMIAEITSHLKANALR